ncbi:Uncharacterised protein [Streptococcus pneumoniae]|nr:Uncharacterised protein [Streptococcus pneumoniae]VQO80850.1 Uncharacterised protein [Streptococcus pneumoniae]VQR22273.1 Uncharacterised protein [Streptococcus pneumoniae]
MVFRLGVNNWGFIDLNFIFITQFHNKTPQKLDFFCLTFGVQFNERISLFFFGFLMKDILPGFVATPDTGMDDTI